MVNETNKQLKTKLTNKQNKTKIGIGLNLHRNIIKKMYIAIFSILICKLQHVHSLDGMSAESI